MEIVCPNCGQVGESDIEPAVGQHVICPFCNDKFTYGKSASAVVPTQRKRQQVDVKCPHCGTAYKLGRSISGKFVKCKACGKGFVARTSIAKKLGNTMNAPRRSLRTFQFRQPSDSAMQDEDKSEGKLKGFLMELVTGALMLIVFLIVRPYMASDKSNAAKSPTASVVKTTAKKATVTNEEAARNAEDLLAWIRNRREMTELARNDAFARLKGKTVILRGKVREVGKTFWSDQVFVSLTVGQLDALERINVQFNVRESLVYRVRTWNKEEVHTMRGRINEKGDLEDDVKCDLAEIVE